MYAIEAAVVDGGGVEVVGDNACGWRLWLDWGVAVMKWWGLVTALYNHLEAV